MPNATKNDAAGIVRPGEVLTLSAAKRCLEVGDWGWRSIRDMGVPTVKVGRQNYVMSDDLIALFSRLRNGEGGTR